jgi:CDI immunity protein
LLSGLLRLLSNNRPTSPYTRLDNAFNAHLEQHKSNLDYCETLNTSWFDQTFGARYIRRAELLFNEETLLLEGLPGCFGNSGSKFVCQTPLREYFSNSSSNEDLGQIVLQGIAFSEAMIEDFLLNSLRQNLEKSRINSQLEREKIRNQELLTRSGMANLGDLRKSLKQVIIDVDKTIIRLRPTSHTKVDQWNVIVNSSGAPHAIECPRLIEREQLGSSLRAAMEQCSSKWS